MCYLYAQCWPPTSFQINLTDAAALSDFCEERLAMSPGKYLEGSALSIADVVVAVCLVSALFLWDWSRYPKLCAWFRLVRQEPSLFAALQGESAASERAVVTPVDGGCWLSGLKVLPFEMLRS
jgi:glutathione S-transferase